MIQHFHKISSRVSLFCVNASGKNMLTNNWLFFGLFSLSKLVDCFSPAEDIEHIELLRDPRDDGEDGGVWKVKLPSPLFVSLIT